MANIKAALKSIRQNQKRRLRNIGVLSELKTLEKKYFSLLSTGEKEKITAFLPEVVKKVDMAATKGIIHFNAAARTKSRLMKHLTVLK